MVYIQIICASRREKQVINKEQGGHGSNHPKTEAGSQEQRRRELLKGDKKVHPTSCLWAEPSLRGDKDLCAKGPQRPRDLVVHVQLHEDSKGILI